MVTTIFCVIIDFNKLIDPPTSDGLTDHPQVSTGLLIFITMATVIFTSVAMTLIILAIALRKNKYVTNYMFKVK